MLRITSVEMTDYSSGVVREQSVCFLGASSFTYRIGHLLEW